MILYPWLRDGTNLRSPSWIQHCVHIASVIVSALEDDRTSLHRWHNLENNCSTDTTVPGMARTSCAIHTIMGNCAAFTYNASVSILSLCKMIVYLPPLEQLTPSVHAVEPEEGTVSMIKCVEVIFTLSHAQYTTDLVSGFGKGECHTVGSNALLRTWSSLVSCTTSAIVAMTAIVVTSNTFQSKPWSGLELSSRGRCWECSSVGWSPMYRTNSIEMSMHDVYTRVMNSVALTWMCLGVETSVKKPCKYHVLHGFWCDTHVQYLHVYGKQFKPCIHSIYTIQLEAYLSS